MSKRDYHVVPHEQGWAVKREGAQRSSSVHATKREALGAGKGLAQTHRTELVIHGKNGRIQDSDSYGNDPVPPKDTKH